MAMCVMSGCLLGRRRFVSAWKPTPQQAQIMRIIRRFQLGAPFDKILGKPTPKIFGPFTIIGTSIVIIEAELAFFPTERKIRHDLHLLTQRGFVKKHSSSPRLFFTPLEYTTEDGVRVRLCDEQLDRMELQYGNRQDIRRGGGVHPSYALTPSGFDLLDQQEDVVQPKPKKRDRSKQQRFTEKEKEFLDLYATGQSPQTIQSWLKVSKSRYYQLREQCIDRNPKQYAVAEKARLRTVAESAKRITRQSSSQKSARIRSERAAQERRYGA